MEYSFTKEFTMEELMDTLLQSKIKNKKELIKITLEYFVEKQKPINYNEVCSYVDLFMLDQELVSYSELASKIYYL